MSSDFLSRLKIQANHITFSGLIFSAIGMYFISMGKWHAAFACLSLAGLADLLDGYVARLNHTAGAFGALFDSVCDRLSDAFYFSGFAVWFMKNGNLNGVLLSLSALSAGFLVSYIRARGEGLGQPCFEGFWERGERFFYLLTGLLFCRPESTVLVLGVFVYFTVLKRLVVLHNRFQGLNSEINSSALIHRKSKYRRLTFWVTAATYISLLFLLKKPF